MTTTTDVTVWCDGEPGAERMSCGEWIIGTNTVSVRRDAKAEGWRVGVKSEGRPRDYCPEHASQASNPAQPVPDEGGKP